MWRQDALTPVIPYCCSEEAEEDRNIFDEVEEEEEEDGEDLMGDEMFE